jgi:hypothetical protein
VTHVLGVVATATDPLDGELGLDGGRGLDVGLLDGGRGLDVGFLDGLDVGFLDGLDVGFLDGLRGLDVGRGLDGADRAGGALGSVTPTASQAAATCPAYPPANVRVHCRALRKFDRGVRQAVLAL